MPLYDIAAGIKPAEPVSALHRAMDSRAQRRLLEAQALVMETNVANADRNFALEERKVGVSETRNQIDSDELGLKYSQWITEQATGMSEGQKRAADFFEELNVSYANAYDQATQSGADESAAAQAANQAVQPMVGNLPPAYQRNFQGMDYRVASAIRQSREANLSQDMREVNIGGSWQEMPVNFDKRTGQNFITGQDGSRQYLNPQQVRDSTKRSETGQLSKPESAQFRQAEAAARNYHSLVTRTIDLLDENPDANTFAARGASLFETMKYEVNSGLRALGIQNDPALEDAATYESTFKRLGLLGEGNARMRSMITTLAYTAASALAGQSGREVSNREVDMFIDAIGAGSSKPEVFKKVLLDTAVTVDDAVRNKYVALSRTDPNLAPPGDMGLEAIRSKVLGDKDGWREVAPGVRVRVKSQ